MSQLLALANLWLTGHFMANMLAILWPCYGHFPFREFMAFWPFVGEKRIYGQNMAKSFGCPIFYGLQAIIHWTIGQNVWPFRPLHGLLGHCMAF